jgi:AcrR family transcriptional regulator
VTDPELPRHLRLLWALPETRRGPRPRQTIQGIGAAAVALADAEGLAAVSMKAVAEALGMTTMSLYRYLDAKEDLYEVMLDQAYGPPLPPDELGARADWRSRLSGWAHALAGALLAHPWIVEVPMSSPPTTPNVLGWTDLGVAALSGTGLEDDGDFYTEELEFGLGVVLDGIAALVDRTG